MLFLLLMCISESSLAKLVIRHDEVDQYDMERVKREGELVTTYTRDHPECGGVEQDVWEYRYHFLTEEGEEEASTATVYSVADIIWDTEEIVNVEEQWIKAIIYIRSTNVSIISKLRCLRMNTSCIKCHLFILKNFL